MSERTKRRLLAVYLIYTNAGIAVSESMKKAVESIEAEQMARKVAEVKA